MRRAPGRRRRKLDRSLVEGPIAPAVWKMAWPTVLQNAIGGLQGIIDHAMVGHYVGFTGNAAIGVSWQIFLVVIVFIASLFTGMGVLVARFAGANEPEKVNRTVYQAFLTALVLSLVVLGAARLRAVADAPRSRQRHARGQARGAAVPADDVRLQHRDAAVLHARRRAAIGRRCADAAAPRILMTVLNVAFNVMLIPGYGPVPAFGTRGAAIGTASASLIVSSIGIWLLLSGRLVVHFPKTMSRRRT